VALTTYMSATKSRLPNLAAGRGDIGCVEITATGISKRTAWFAVQALRVASAEGPTMILGYGAPCTTPWENTYNTSASMRRWASRSASSLSLRPDIASWISLPKTSSMPV
jgi:hypothetical protein